MQCHQGMVLGLKVFTSSLVLVKGIVHNENFLIIYSHPRYAFLSSEANESSNVMCKIELVQDKHLWLKSISFFILFRKCLIPRLGLCRQNPLKLHWNYNLSLQPIETLECFSAKPFVLNLVWHVGEYICWSWSFLFRRWTNHLNPCFSSLCPTINWKP